MGGIVKTKLSLLILACNRIAIAMVSDLKLR